MKRSPLKRKTPLRARKPAQGGAETRRTALRAKRWGVRKAPKPAENWRDEYMPEWMLGEPAPKLTPYEAALKAFVKAQACLCCGRRGPSDPAHMSLSRNQKGMGMRVPHTQIVPLCRRCHRAYDTRSQQFAGWSDDRRYTRARGWLDVVAEATTPRADGKDHALALEAAGLGWIEDMGAGRWAWHPGAREERAA